MQHAWISVCISFDSCHAKNYLIKHYFSCSSDLMSICKHLILCIYLFSYMQVTETTRESTVWQYVVSNIQQTMAVSS